MISALHINATYSVGGAASVMGRLVSSMHRYDVVSKILAGDEKSKNCALQIDKAFGGLFSYCLWRGLLDYQIQKSHHLFAHPLIREADILHFHNLHGGYFNLWSLPLLSALKPAVWTLHDMQALTGHCAHSLECRRWLPDTGCGNCPHLDTYPGLRRDATRRLWQDKRTIYAHSSLYLVTPSVWLQRLVAKSALGEQPLVCIPNGADTTVYRPQDKAAARRLLGVPQDVVLVGGCAVGGVNSPWKGGAFALSTILELKKHFPNLHFLNIGVKEAPSEFDNADWVHQISYVHEPAQLARLYAALDLLLYPSVADNHPLVCIECLCCGTPVAGFATGGVPEIVRHGEDGLLVPPRDGASLTKAAILLLRDGSFRERMAREIAVGAARRFNLDLFAQRYKKVYEEMLHMPRSLEKSRLPMSGIPALIKSPGFMRQEWRKYGHPSLRQRLELLFNSIKGSICVALVVAAGWPVQAARTLRSVCFRYRKR